MERRTYRIVGSFFQGFAPCKQLYFNFFPHEFGYFNPLDES